MLACRDQLEVFAVVALHPAHKSHGIARGQRWIFPGRLHPAPPAPVSDDVDIGREHRQRPAPQIREGAELVRDGAADALEQRVVE